MKKPILEGSVSGNTTREGKKIILWRWNPETKEFDIPVEITLPKKEIPVSSGAPRSKSF